MERRQTISVADISERLFTIENTALPAVAGESVLGNDCLWIWRWCAARVVTRLAVGSNFNVVALPLNNMLVWPGDRT